MVLFESCRYEAMKQCRLSYGTSQSDLSENYLYPFCHGYLGYSNVNIAGILLLLDSSCGVNVPICWFWFFHQLMLSPRLSCSRLVHTFSSFDVREKRMVLFESCRYEAMKQCRLSYGTSQSDLSENYLYPFCHGYLGYSNVNIAGILLLLDSSCGVNVPICWFWFFHQLMLSSQRLWCGC